MSNAYLVRARWNEMLCQCIRCLCRDFCCVVVVVAVAVVSCCCCVHFFVLHRIFFRKFVDVFVNMAYRYSSGLTRFKSDIYSFHCTRIYLCVCLLFFGLLVFFTTHINMRCVYTYIFFLLFCVYIVLGCFWYTAFYPLRLFVFYLQSSFFCGKYTHFFARGQLFCHCWQTELCVFIPFVRITAVES